MDYNLFKVIISWKDIFSSLKGEERVFAESFKEEDQSSIYETSFLRIVDEGEDKDEVLDIFGKRRLKNAFLKLCCHCVIKVMEGQNAPGSLASESIMSGEESRSYLIRKLNPKSREELLTTWAGTEYLNIEEAARKADRIWI